MRRTIPISEAFSGASQAESADDTYDTFFVVPRRPEPAEGERADRDALAPVSFLRALLVPRTPRERTTASRAAASPSGGPATSPRLAPRSVDELRREIARADAGIANAGRRALVSAALVLLTLGVIGFAAVYLIGQSSRWRWHAPLPPAQIAKADRLPIGRAP